MSFQERILGGFEPKHGAGCMIMSRRTGKFLLNLRPEEGEAGGTWSLWGGKAEPGENSRETALREVFEETGVRLEGELMHLRHKDMGRFFYDTFLLVVEDEFIPSKTFESAGHVWTPLDALPSPLHWGIIDLLGDRTAVKILTRSVENMTGRPCDFDDVYRDED